MNTGLALSVGLLSGGGALFMVWRTIVALRSGTIWLRGQTMTRIGEPTWFWAYLATYLLILAVMIYGVSKAVIG